MHVTAAKAYAPPLSRQGPEALHVGRRYVRHMYMALGLPPGSNKGLASRVEMSLHAVFKIIVSHGEYV